MFAYEVRKYISLNIQKLTIWSPPLNFQQSLVSDLMHYLWLRQRKVNRDHTMEKKYINQLLFSFRVNYIQYCLHINIAQNTSHFYSTDFCAILIHGASVTFDAVRCNNFPIIIPFHFDAFQYTGVFNSLPEIFEKDNCSYKTFDPILIKCEQIQSFRNKFPARRKAIDFQESVFGNQSHFTQLRFSYKEFRLNISFPRNEFLFIS